MLRRLLIPIVGLIRLITGEVPVESVNLFTLIERQGELKSDY